MSRKYIIANGILRAAAILASAILKAPTSLTLILLPGLATISWLGSLSGSARSGCDA